MFFLSYCGNDNCKVVLSFLCIFPPLKRYPASGKFLKGRSFNHKGKEYVCHRPLIADVCYFA